MLYPVIPSEMDTNIKIVEKIDPWTILGRAIKMQETNRFLPIMGDKDVDSFLETCRNQLQTQYRDINCVPNDQRLQDGIKNILSHNLKLDY